MVSEVHLIFAILISIVSAVLGEKETSTVLPYHACRKCRDVCNKLESFSNDQAVCHNEVSCLYLHLLICKLRYNKLTRH